MSKKNACKKFQSVIFSAISIVFLFLLFGKNTNLQAKSSKTETYKEFIDGYNKTTLELFYFINSAPFDLTICPFSIENTLLMAYMGAQKETSNAFEKALSLNLPKSKIPKVFEKESSDLSSRIKGKTSYTFSQANAVWVANSINILSSYKKIVKKDFNSDVFNIDFTHPTLATYKINTWISNQTKKAIPTFLATNNIPESTTMMLTSACVFKGQWKYPIPNATYCKKTFSFPLRWIR